MKWPCRSGGVESYSNQEAHLGTKAFNALYRRLSRAGFSPEFVRSALLPDWWSKDCEKDPQLLADLAFRVARFLNAPVSAVERDAKLTAPVYAGARLRHIRNIDANRLGPTIHAGLSVAAAVVRSLRNPQPVRLLSNEAGSWAADLLARNASISLTAVVSDSSGRVGFPSFTSRSCPILSSRGLRAS